MLLTGQYRRTLDDKLRVAVPKPLREALLAGPLYVTPGLDGCLALYAEAQFAQLADRLAGGSPAAPATRDYSRLFFSQAECVTADRQGRVRLPGSLAEWAQLAGDVVLVGVRDHLEIWNAAAWNAYVAQRDHQFNELAELALGGGAASSPPRPTPWPASQAEAPVTQRTTPR